MTKSQVSSPLSLCGPDLPRLQAVITRDCLPGLPCLPTAVIALDIFKAEYPPARQNIYLWKTFNSNPAYTEPFVMTPLPVVPVSPVWAGHDLGKCWAKFPASAPAGDTSLTL